MKNTKKLVALLLLAMCLVLGGVIGGTLAYLMTQTPDVTNTFVAGNIGTLKLEEKNGNSFIVTPGVDINKDPTVTFYGNNVAAYVFVKVEQTGWQVSDDGMTYSCVGGKVTWKIVGEWTHLGKGVYYREVAADTDTANIEKYGIIANNTITVSTAIEQSELTDSAVPKLSFTAYAVQKDTFEGPKAAWDATFGKN